MIEQAHKTDGLFQTLSNPLARRLLGQDELVKDEAPSRFDALSFSLDWCQQLSQRIDFVLEEAADQKEICNKVAEIGESALQSFLQANVTGPPLLWNPEELFYHPDSFSKSGFSREQHQFQLRSQLSVDGEAVWRLLPHVELFTLSKCLLNHPFPEQSSKLLIWRLRVNTWHQRLLNDLSPTLQGVIYQDLSLIDVDKSPECLIERASIHLLHGFDAKARQDLQLAAEKRRFDYALTGRLGKRTKFQENELSQLVVLAKSYDANDHEISEHTDEELLTNSGPKGLDLSDDTILDSIMFTKNVKSDAQEFQEQALPSSLSALDPGNQPLLKPLDGIILLALASAMSSTSAQDELTREEILPYAERVIRGGSSNWQVYTQALLVRSRIESYKSRRIERSVLQLQALVDQVIAETTGPTNASGSSIGPPNSTTFLPRSSSTESAPASERLVYIHQLASPPRWKLEAELADRWVSLGGLRTALEIYERLEMRAEVALCWAANDQEDKARTVVLHQLYEPGVKPPTPKILKGEDEDEPSEGQVERDPLPADAPRLFCILGDIDKSPAAYERAWEISNHRFARAQRSLGKYYQAQGDTKRAEEAYARSLKVNPQNHKTWFALGCARLRLERWYSAADAFGRAVQIDDTDAESWSNLAVSLLRSSDSLGLEATKEEKQQRIGESFVALKRAAALKRESFQIWQNLLSVSVKLVPPPYTDIVIAQTRLIDLLGNTQGEKCVDVPMMEALLADMINTSHREAYSDRQPNGQKPRVGLEKMVVDLIQKKITPLITSSRRLWILTAKLSLHLQRPFAALTAYEKAWRSQLNKPSWDTGLGSESKNLWREVAEATSDLIDAYESLGERSRKTGMAEGEVVAKDWRFKARSAARSVLARAKNVWEDDEAYERLSGRLQDLKAG